jgi:hypothetical protein
VSIGDRLDRLPWSAFDTRLTLALGIGWLLDAFEVNIIGRAKFASPSKGGITG